MKCCRLIWPEHFDWPSLPMFVVGSQLELLFLQQSCVMQFREQGCKGNHERCGQCALLCTYGPLALLRYHFISSKKWHLRISQFDSWPSGALKSSSEDVRTCRWRSFKQTHRLHVYLLQSEHQPVSPELKKKGWFPPGRVLLSVFNQWKRSRIFKNMGLSLASENFCIPKTVGSLFE